MALEIGPNRIERQPRDRGLLERIRRRLTVLLERGLLDSVERDQAGELLYDYWMARYPVTVAQFGCFVRAGGYAQQGWWRTRAARAWLQESGRTAPERWDGQCLHPNRPVTNVTWFEAMAYCAWLDAQMRQLHSALIPPGYELRLPTEAEWEKAARSGERRRYPWGDQDWDRQKANIRDSGFGRPTPVGLHPKGATPAGLHDMAGNVWEWTLTQGGAYPYDPKRNKREGSDWRVLRGGSWLSISWAARCAYRDWSNPGLWSTSGGLRGVVSPEHSEF